MTEVSTAPIAPYVHRAATLEFARRRLTFATSHGLFSSHQVDVGSQLLLRTLEPVVAERGAEGARVLDLGCGYGTLGAALATMPGVASAHLVDRDALALDFARANAQQNGVEDRVTVAPSLGLDEVAASDGYDLVVSNVPGKAGEPIIRAMLLGMLGVLAPDTGNGGGLAAVVVIEPIRDLVATTLARADIEVTLRRDTADYSVFHYRPAATPASVASLPRPVDGFASGLYDHGSVSFENAHDVEVTIATVQSVPGYDRVDTTEIAVTRRMPPARRAAHVLISNVTQGYLAAWLLPTHADARFILVDRDLLALRTARRTLLTLGCAEDRVELRHVGACNASTLRDAQADLVVGALREDAGAPAVEAEYAALLGALAPGGHAVLAGSSTAVTRLLALPLPAGLRASRTRHRGTSVLEVIRAAG